FWLIRNHVREGQTFLEKVLAGSEEEVTSARAEALRYLGILLETMGEYKQAEKPCEESLALYRQLGDPAGVAWARYALGQVAFDLILLRKVLFVSQAGSTALDPALEEYFSLAPEERDPASMGALDRLETITPSRPVSVFLSTRMYGRLYLLGELALSQGDVVK